MGTSICSEEYFLDAREGFQKPANPPNLGSRIFGRLNPAAGEFGSLNPTESTMTFWLFSNFFRNSIFSDSILQKIVHKAPKDPPTFDNAAFDSFLYANADRCDIDHTIFYLLVNWFFVFLFIFFLFFLIFTFCFPNSECVLDDALFICANSLL